MAIQITPRFADMESNRVIAIDLRYQGESRTVLAEINYIPHIHSDDQITMSIRAYGHKDFDNMPVTSGFENIADRIVSWINIAADSRSGLTVDQRNNATDRLTTMLRDLAGGKAHCRALAGGE